MSAPTPAPGDDRPREGYYPDPSIPGYVRYWNGASWVPGTSRPAPKDGESFAPPPGAGAARPAPVEETGPHFFDEDPVAEPSAADAQHGSRPEPASAWGADRSRQSGFGSDQDRRVSWGAPQGAQGGQGGAQQGTDPRVPHADRQPDGESVRADGKVPASPAQGGSPSRAGQEPNAAADGTFVFRRPTGKSGGGAAADAPDEGTMTFRAVSPRAGGSGGGAKPPGSPGGGAGGSGVNSGAAGFGSVDPGIGAPAGPSGPAGHSGASGFGPAGPAFGGQAGSAASGATPSGPAFGAQGGAAGSGGNSGSPGFGSDGPAVPGTGQAGPAFGAQPGAAGSGSGPAGPGFGAGKAAAQAAAQGGAQAPAALSGPQAAPVPPQSAGPGSPQPAAASPATPLSAGLGGGQSSWAQQVHRLAGGGGGDEQPVAPWKPPVEDVFQAVARRQASARPAGLGKRLAARLLDTVVLACLTAAAAVPLGMKAVDHVNEKIDEARLSGETVTVWLLDGTTSVYLGIIVAVLLLAGVLSEVLPTAKWGRTLGKKLMGLDVRDIEGHDVPGFGASLRRWMVYSVPGLLVIGIVGVAWCLFDRPWRQCWHDKVAHTFVAG
ncbi:RDD family protein [Streptomyces sp. NPDC096046]|uniref:RDD family protein n=1 Tax=Streptomyces sp. NPDC096046 TaxID=3155542 RepID=UPI003327169D